MKNLLLLTIVLALIACEKDNTPLNIESYLNGKSVQKITTNPSGSKVFFLSAVIDESASPFLCSVPYIYQLSCTDGSKTLYFDNLKSVIDMAVDEECNLYACMLNKLVKFTPPHDSAVIKTASTAFSSVIADAEGKLWASTYGDGLYYYDKHVWYRYSSHNSNLTGNNISRVEIGRNNDIWLAVEGDTASVTHISDGVFTTYKWKDLIGKNVSYISHLAVDKNGKAWISYYIDNTRYLVTVDRNGGLTQQSLNFIGAHNIINLRSDYKGDIYLIIYLEAQSQSKVYTHNGSNWYELVVNSSDNFIHDVTLDENQNVWAGTTNGILKTTLQLVGTGD